MKRTTGRSPSARRRGSHVLPIITALLIGSGLARIGEGASQVRAQAADPVPEIEMPELASGALSCLPEDTPGALVAALRQREERVTEREAQLAERMERLAQVEAEIEGMLAELSRAEASLAETVALAETGAAEDLAQLTQVYENMRPADAAALFEQMDPAFGAGFMGLMRPEAAAAIMTKLDPNTAYSISVILAGRNARAPTQ